MVLLELNAKRFVNYNFSLRLKTDILTELPMLEPREFPNLGLVQTKVLRINLVLAWGKWNAEAPLVAWL